MRYKRLQSDKALIPVIASLVLVLLTPLAFHVYLNRTAPIRHVASEEALPAELDGLLPVAQLQPFVSAKTTDKKVKKIELKKTAGGIVYRVLFADGNVTSYDAYNGTKLDSTNQIPSNGLQTLPDDFVPSRDFQQAREVARQKYPEGEILDIQMIFVNDVVVYSVRFTDGGSVDVNAATGDVVRLNVAGRSEGITTPEAAEPTGDTPAVARSVAKGSPMRPAASQATPSPSPLPTPPPAAGQPQLPNAEPTPQPTPPPSSQTSLVPDGKHTEPNQAEAEKSIDATQVPAVQ